MSYFDQAQLSQDTDFGLRIAACAAVEVDELDGTAQLWAYNHQWEIAAAPGFADAYAWAIAGDVENPGRDPAVISDAQLLAAVQAIAAP